MKGKLFFIFGMALVFALSPIAANAQKFSYGEHDLIPWYFRASSLYYHWMGGAYLSGTGDYTFYIPLQLPEGKSIRWIRMNFYDNVTTSGYQIDATVYRYNKFTGDWEGIYDVDTAGSWGDVNSTVIDFTPYDGERAFIQNGPCSYFVYVYFATANTDLRFLGLTVYVQ